jgi:hypothetical protein
LENQNNIFILKKIIFNINTSKKLKKQNKINLKLKKSFKKISLVVKINTVLVLK